MAAEQRRLLEQLMGADAMVGSTHQQAALSITDSKVCRSFLCGSCPHDLFTNTKQDLGSCKKSHPPNLKEEYEKASDEQKREWGFDFDYQRDISKYISECDWRIDTAQQRLEQTDDEAAKNRELVKKIGDLRESINCGVKEIEALIGLGLVNQAVMDYHYIKLKHAEKESRQHELAALTETAGPSGHQKLQVCDTCGAYLSRLDNNRRLADHFYGRMHLGFSTMRKELKRLNTELKGRAPPVRREQAAETSGYDDGYGRSNGGYGGGGYGDRSGGFSRRGGGYGRRGRY